jgi:beta-glucosidase
MTLREKLTLLEGVQVGLPATQGPPVTQWRHAIQTAPLIPVTPASPGASASLGGPASPRSLMTQDAASQYELGYLPGIPRLGIPALRIGAGPARVAASQPSTATTAATGVAATFSQRDAYNNGVVIGRVARALGQDAVAGPDVNIYRDPAWTGASPTFGEDPLLTGQTAAAEISGIQSQGTMAMVGNYLTDNGGANVVVDEQALHEIYLQPFTDAIRAGVASVMCSAGTVQVVGATPSGPLSPGALSCANAQTLTGILRGELGFQGFVSSDWGAASPTLSLNSGLDTELPGNGGALPQSFSVAALSAAIANGSVRVATINQAVGRILVEMNRFGLLGTASPQSAAVKSAQPASTKRADTDEQVMLQTAQDAATLLKNAGHALPLRRAELSSLALIGPGAAQAIGAGASGGGAASQQASTYRMLQQDFTKYRGAHLSYAVGENMTGTPVPAAALSHNGQPGLVRTDAGSGATRIAATLDDTVAGRDALAAGSGHVWKGDLAVPVAGKYWINLGLLGAGGSLTLDGKVIARTGSLTGTGALRDSVTRPGDDSVLPATHGLDNLRAQVSLTAGSHPLSITVLPDASGRPVQVRLDWVTPAQQEANLDQAVSTAKQAKAAVVFAWSAGSLAAPLPDGQDQLIENVAAANPNTIVVLNTRGPVAMPWLGSVKSVLEMWYPGAMGGYATANVLLGQTDPAGRLPFTWPRALDQGVADQAVRHPERTSNGVDATGRYCANPARTSGARPVCTTTHTEGIFVGYRWYDQQGETPLFPFGYGLSYTTFRYFGLQSSMAADGGLNLTFQVTNTGRVAGGVVPQVYLGPPDRPPAGAAFAVRALAAYTRVSVGAGQTKTVTVQVPKRQLQYWDTAKGWVTADGQRPLYVSADERTDKLTALVTIPG